MSRDFRLYCLKGIFRFPDVVFFSIIFWIICRGRSSKVFITHFWDEWQVINCLWDIQWFYLIFGEFFEFILNFHAEGDGLQVVKCLWNISWFNLNFLGIFPIFFWIIMQREVKFAKVLLLTTKQTQLGLYHFHLFLVHPPWPCPFLPIKTHPR